MSANAYNKNMTFKKRHNHPAVKGQFHADCEACELILSGESTTGVVYGRNGAEVKRSWKKTSSTP